MLEPSKILTYKSFSHGVKLCVSTTLHLNMYELMIYIDIRATIFVLLNRTTFLDQTVECLFI